MSQRKDKSEYPILPLPVLRRLPFYYTYLLEHQAGGLVSVSSSQMADDLNLHPVQVRKDLAMTQVSGRPRTGFNVKDLIERLEEMLGYNDVKPALLVGSGHLGSALVNYSGFEGFGLNFVAAFDADESKVGKKIGDLTIRSMDEINEAIDEFDIKIAVIAVPGSVSQEVCDRLMEPRKIKAVWNFAPNHLQVPKGVILQNENIAASLSVLSKRLMDQEYMEAQGQEHEDEDEDLGPHTRF